MRAYSYLLLMLVILGSCNYDTAPYLPEKSSYLKDIKSCFQKKYPERRIVTMVFHGHSVPCGISLSDTVNPLESYPHLVLKKIKESYPYALVNIVLTCKEAENSKPGAERFAKEVLIHKPDIVVVDYALNDVGLGVEKAREYWEQIITMSLDNNAKVILLTPTPDLRRNIADTSDALNQHRKMIIELANEYHVGLVDNYLYFYNYYTLHGSVDSFMVSVNHPNHRGHEIVANNIMEWF